MKTLKVWVTVLNGLIDMTFDKSELTEYPFDGLFYELLREGGDGLLDEEVKEVEVLRTKCDIQSSSQSSDITYLTGSYTIYFPLEFASGFFRKPKNDDENEKEGVNPTDKELVDDKTYEPIKIKRGMYFRGVAYGYEVNGKVTAVVPSMLGGVCCQVKDVDE